MILLDHWGLCPYCLANRNHTTSIRVHYTSENMQYVIAAGNPTDPKYLDAWIRGFLKYEDVNFEINQYMNAFIPVAIVNGSPVCPWHLWEHARP